jgi:hypothetical protein
MAAPALKGRPRSVAERRGRLVAIVAFYGFVAAFCVVATVEISLQVFEDRAGEGAPASCEEGLVQLTDAIARARGAAQGIHTEEVALRRYREALEPEWRAEGAIRAACEGTPSREGALDAILRLRYAEEHAVRRGAGDLAPLRARVRAIVEPLRQKPPARP